MFKMRLRTALFCMFAFSALLPVLFLAFYIQKNAFTREINSVRERHLLVARNLTSALIRYSTDVEAIMVDICTHIDHRLVDGHFHLLKTIGITLLAEFDDSGNVGDIFYGNSEYLPKMELPDILRDEQLRNFGKIQISGVFASRSGVPAIYLFWQDEKGNRILANLSTDYIVEVQQAVTFGKQGHAAIIDHKGHLIAHPEAEWQATMKDISGLAPAKEMMLGKTGVIQFFSPAVKADMVAGYSVVPSTGWGVMIPQPMSELEEHAAMVRQAALIICVLGFLFSMLIGRWLSQMISKPILSTVDAARLLVTSSPGMRAKVSDNSNILELEQLCTRFNEMAHQVEDARLNLEKRVEKRTSALSNEVKERKKLERKFRHMATHDSLTGLVNRNLFMDRLNKVLQHSARSEKGIAVMFIDLDGFKKVNDNLGHVAGDQLLVEVAARLKSSVRKSDTVGRYGGDEFIVLLLEVDDKEKIRSIAEKLLAQLQFHFSIEHENINVSASIGIAIGSSGDERSALIDSADTAMYQAKEKGKNCYIFAEKSD